MYRGLLLCPYEKDKKTASDVYKKLTISLIGGILYAVWLNEVIN
jgi:hypothetical protein